MAVFGDDTFRNALFARTGFFVVFITIEEENDIRVLLDRTRISKVGKHRTFIRTAFRTTGKLCATNDGDLELFCENFQSARDIADLEYAVVGSSAFALHKLEIVHDDKTEVFHAAQLCFHTGYGDTRGIIDENVTFGKLSGGIGKLFVLFRCEIARTDSIAIDERFAGKHTGSELFRRHFKRKDAHVLFCRFCDIGSEIHTKTRFTHTGSRADDDKVAFAKTDECAVEGRISCRCSRCGGFIAREKVKTRIGSADGFTDMHKALIFTALRDGKDLLLGAVDDILDLALRCECHFTNFVRCADERAQKALFADDLCIVQYVCGGRNGFRNDLDIFFAFFFVVYTARNECINERYKVDLSAFREKIVHGVKNFAVLLEIKILRAENFSKVGKAVRVDQDRAENRLLRFQGAWEISLDVCHKNLRFYNDFGAYLSETTTVILPEISG